MGEEKREHFKSRIGFIFVAAGCAIGLGNVWRFPYITGQSGGAAFIVFMGFAALSTVIGVFELLVTWSMDRWGWSRKQAVIRNGVALAVLSIPCVLGLNVWSAIAIPGIGDISSIEDFIVSNNILPLGGILFAIFCCSKWGWGWNNFVAEADTGKGMKFPKFLRLWCTYGIPILGVIIFIMGYAPLIGSWIG